MKQFIMIALAVLGICLIYNSVQADIPLAPTLNSPSDTTYDTTPGFTWNAVSNATWYQLWISDTTGCVYKKWYTDVSVTSGSTCSVTPDTTLNSGEYTWWIRTWNSSGYSQWSPGMNFAINGGSTPVAATLTYPSGNILNNVTVYTWNAVSDSTWYYLWVNDSTGNKIKTWYKAEDCGCGSGTGTCSITPSNSTSLSSGEATWWIGTWNEYGSGPWSSGTHFTVGRNSSAIIIDHTCTDLNQIPQTWVSHAKSNLRLTYGHTSHGSQPVTGMQVLMNENNLYAFNTDGSIQNGVLSLDDYNPGGDLGHNGDTSWADRTRTWLNNSGSDRNVVIWSWCGGASDNTETGINTYLSAMNQLESEYPAVTFVYMTGHLDGTGQTGNLQIRNNDIRNYCENNNKILFDFADIESYDPDGKNYLNLGADDECYYNGGADNWAQQWCASNPGSQLCSDCGGSYCCAHSQPLNCNLKARAFWWMLARIAGWNGID